MIAQYQRKFGFTAILVSHEIPDVYFISNRILALYDRKPSFFRARRRSWKILTTRSKMRSSTAWKGSRKN